MDSKAIREKMNNAISHFEKELLSIRTSRANTAILDNILIDSYGTKVPLNQLGNLSVPDASMLTIQVWDTNLLKPIENAIIKCCGKERNRKCHNLEDSNTRGMTFRTQ